MKKGVIGQIGKSVFSTACIIGLGYIAVTADYSNLTKTTGDQLTATNWNQLVNNVKGVFTDSSGNVGIGTTGPYFQLHLDEDHSDHSNQLVLGNSVGTGWGVRVGKISNLGWGHGNTDKVIAGIGAKYQDGMGQITFNSLFICLT